MGQSKIISKIPIVGADGEILSKEPNQELSNQTGERMPFEDFDMYQMLAERSNVTPPENRLFEILTGLAEEQGEFMSFHKRMARGDYKTQAEQTEALGLAMKELGDMLWYMSAWCTIHHIPFGEVAFANIEKLSKRMDQNKVHGSGDTREEDTIEADSTDSDSVSPVEDSQDEDK